MIKDLILPGDFFLVDSQRTGAKIVKFFQTAPTWYQHLWRKITGTQETVLYYHVGMFVDGETIIEQQGKVQENTSTKLLNTNNNLLIVRKIGLSYAERDCLISTARKDLGEGYDVMNIFGKLFTWLTGIPIFALFMQLPNMDICVNRVSYWYRVAVGEKFGTFTASGLTTHSLYKYIIAHPEKFVIVFIGNPRKDIINAR